MRKRSPLRRTQPGAKSSVPVANARCKAKGCRNRFVKLSMRHRACSPECAKVVIEQDKAEDARKAAREDRKQTRAQLEAMKTIPQLKKEAQHAFNRAIRARDRLSGVGCICCGRPLRWDMVGGAVDAGHYRSTGSADHLRFNEDNCHAQLAECNRYGAGRAVDYRIGLIARIGLERVEALESNNTPVKWTRESLRAIRDTYRAKARELEKQL